MRYHLFQKFFEKMVKIKEMSFLSTRGMYLSCHGCKYVCTHTWKNTQTRHATNAILQSHLFMWQVSTYTFIKFR